jgi:hypothetical protein
MMISVDRLVGKVARKIDVLRENLFRCRFVHQKSYITRPGLEPWPLLWEAGD